MTTAPQPATLAELLMGGESQEIQLGSVGQEQYCRLVAAGNPYDAAYRKAYGVDAKTEVWPQVNRIMRAPHIVARITQLRTQAIKGFAVERNMLLENLLWALNTARERGATDQVRKIVMDIGKLFGLVVDKVEANVFGQFQVMRDVTLNGDQLMFDVGSGAPVAIKGELQKLQNNSGLEDETAPNAIKTLEIQGDTDPLAALQNASKTLPAKPVELDEVPIEGVLEVGEGLAGGKVQVAKPATQRPNTRARPVRRRADHVGEELTAAELALIG